MEIGTDQIRNIDRQAVRELARKNHEELVAAINRGENHYQLSLDQSDKVESQYTVGMTGDEKTRFYEILAEETEAIGAQVEMGVRQLQEKAQASNEIAENIGNIFAVIIFLVVIFFFLKAIA